jgi:hypothetical protein
MLGGLFRVIACEMLCACCFGSEMQTDTIRLAAHLKPFRHYKLYELSGAQYKTIQKEYLSWIGSRFKRGVTLAQMNEELEAANLLSDGPKDVDDMEKSFAGFLGPVEALPLGVTGLVALKFGIYSGSLCNLDETAVLYDAGTLEELARLNAEAVSARGLRYGYDLRTLSVGKDDAVRGRIIASAWVISNCTSNWNGNNFRIDVSLGQSSSTVLNRGVAAFFGDPVDIRIEETIPSRSNTRLCRATVANYSARASQFTGFKTTARAGKVRLHYRSAASLTNGWI